MSALEACGFTPEQASALTAAGYTVIGWAPVLEAGEAW